MYLAHSQLLPGAVDLLEQGEGEDGFCGDAGEEVALALPAQVLLVWAGFSQKCAIANLYFGYLPVGVLLVQVDHH